MKKQVGLLGAVSMGIGMIVATSCFVPLAGGSSMAGVPFIIAIVLACLINMISAASMAEMNALMPNLTGGLAQYTLAGLGPFVTIVIIVGGYIISNVFAAPAEGTMFAMVMRELIGGNIPAEVYSVGITVLLILINLLGVTMSARIQSVIAVFMISSLFILGIMGAFGLGSGEMVSQKAVISWDFQKILPLMAMAFWLFIGSEFIIPIGKDMKNPRRNVPLSMFLSLAVMCAIQVLMVLGFHNYVPWENLADADSPHITYSVNLLGSFGRFWMIAVAIFAAVSTQNSIIGCVSEICCGMAKSNLLPSVFQKKNKRNAPYVVILLMGAVILGVEASGISNGRAVTFLILTSSLFWMLSYIVAHINVLIFRKKLKYAPRTFRVPFSPVLPLTGIAGTGFMLFHISADPAEKRNIFLLSGILFVLIAVYAVLWIKLRLKIPLLKGMEIKEVMAMEHPLYPYCHQAEKKYKIQKTVELP